MLRGADDEDEEEGTDDEEEEEEEEEAATGTLISWEDAVLLYWLVRLELSALFCERLYCR